MTTPEPDTAERDRIRQQLLQEVSMWETFVAGDGHRSIRMKETRTEEELADAVMATIIDPLLERLQARGGDER